ncbi:unnamed protein product [Rotaria socialis]
MNLAKVFRRHHPKESTSPVRKTSERPSFIHPFQGYPRPFSYHIPATEQLSSSSLTKTSNIVPYRIGLTSDSTLLANGQTNENDDIVRLPVKSGKGHYPKSRKDPRSQSQLNANKRWLFRSMEALDEWKEKVFTQKSRTTDQSRSRSVENLADDDDDDVLINKNPSTVQQHERATSPNRSIEAITNRVINSIGIHRKSTNSISNTTRSPALTIQKQSLFNHSNNVHNNLSKQYNNNNNNEQHPSAILDFREISSVGFLHSRTQLNDNNENISLTTSENIITSINISDDGVAGIEDDEIISNLSCLTNGYDHNDDDHHQVETSDAWDFSVTWLDSLKEQHSPQRKIQFYENLINLLEQDTLNIDELLVLRKILAKIWPINEITTKDSNSQLFSMESKPTPISKSLSNLSKVKQRPKLPKMTHHTAQRCSTIIEPTSLTYEPLHEQNSGHTAKASSLLIAAKAKVCTVENTDELISNQKQTSNSEQTYPQHLNPFDDETGKDKRLINIVKQHRFLSSTDIAPSSESDRNANNDSIRRYFERLTLLETIYEKLNIESNKTPIESMNHPKILAQENVTELSLSSPTITQTNRPNEKQTGTTLDVRNYTRPYSSNKSDINKTILNKFIEMNVDGSGSISSGKSSIKRRAPTAPHISQNDKKKHQQQLDNSNMFSLSSTDLNLTHKTDQDIHSTSIGFKSYDGKYTKQPIENPAASCDDNGHVFVYNSEPNPIHQEQPTVLPKKTERIQQWLSACERKEELNMQNNLSSLSQSTSPKTQLKMRCIAKPNRPSSLSPQLYYEKNLPTVEINEIEPTRFRSCLKINLEKNEPANHQRSRPPSTTLKYYHQQKSFANENLNFTNDDDYFERNTLSPSLHSDYQAVYL